MIYMQKEKGSYWAPIARHSDNDKILKFAANTANFNSNADKWR